MPGDPVLILASASPRRRELLAQIGVDCRVLSAAVDENPWPGEAAEDYVLRLAAAKARAVRCNEPDALPVLGADTVVELDGELLGKPGGRAEGLAMLEKLSGRAHRVYSGVVLVSAAGEQDRLSVSKVWFRALSAVELRAYWETGEALGKAGGYAIQGRAAVFIQRLEGGYSGVMGLPLFETAELLQAAGIELFMSNTSEMNHE